MTYIVLAGDPINGFVCIGPFATREDASTYIDEDPGDETMWIVDLTPPSLNIND